MYSVFKKFMKIFQIDEAPPYFAIAVCQLLDGCLTNQWIGQAGSISRPPQSPDLSACDFWLWGYV